MEGTYILSVLVEDHPGILTRVAGLFSRRGYNIHSLSVGNTHDDTISRITIVVEGDEHIIEQISKQVSKMMEVLKIKILKAGECVSRELALVKVRSTPKTRGEIMEIVSIFRAKIVDISQNTLTIEMSGSENKLNAFLSMVGPYGIEEISRTGLTAIEKKLIRLSLINKAAF